MTLGKYFRIKQGKVSKKSREFSLTGGSHPHSIPILFLISKTMGKMMLLNSDFFVLSEVKLTLKKQKFLENFNMKVSVPLGHIVTFYVRKQCEFDPGMLK